MRRVSDDVPNDLLEIGSMLGLEKEDIIGLEKIILDKDTTMVSLHNPADGYNNAIGLYGTISIKDFK